LDAGLIDKVQVYIAPIFTGGPTIAFASNGAGSTSDATRLTRVRYHKIGPGDFYAVGYTASDRPAIE
jgi:riboflavin biosynthesis pyrimidine reductase